jgi:CheY-like chemotaxis protein
MAKILLVEDDNNLREIYEARLQAEGYEIVSAMDGEEALVVAKKEKPDLVISDVMMPRISGFEMLDILRNTDDLKDVKVIMLTALGQAEDKTRADSLGADRYLVKSQVTLEDIVKAAQELLGEAPVAEAAPATPTAEAPTVAAPAVAPSTPTSTGPAPAPMTTTVSTSVPTPPTVVPVPMAPPVEQAASASTPALAAPPVPSAPAPAPAPVSTPPVVTPPMPTSAPTAPPVDRPAPQPEPAAPIQDAPADGQPDDPAPPTAAPPTQPATQSTSDEQNAIKAQIENFVRLNSQTAPGAETATPEAPTSAPQMPAESTPTSDTMMTDAIKGLVSDAQQQNEAPEVEKTIPAADDASPTDTAPAASAPSTPEQPKTSESESDDDSATVAHKKIIKPITDSSAPAQPNLNELLAREGITAIEDEEHPTLPAADMPPASPLPPAPGGLPTTPHPPGHVISPNPPAQGGVDPNSISL